MSRLIKRNDIDIVDTNCVVLTLAEAVKRWSSDGQFMMTEVNSSDSYQSSDPNIDIGSYSARISKIEAALAGMDFVKDVRAVSESSVSSDISVPAPVDTPAPAGE